MWATLLRFVMSAGIEKSYPTERHLSSRLIAVFVIIIVITAVTASSLAYWLITTELERQAELRVSDSERTTQALLASERERLDTLVTLAVQRPILGQLLQDDDLPAIQAYVDEYREGARVDLLLVHDAVGELIARGETDVACEPSFQRLTDFCLFFESGPLLTVFGGSAILDNDTGELLGYITIGRSLNNNFAQELTDKTGVAHSFIIDGDRVSTSLPGTPPDLDGTLFQAAMVEGQTSRSRLFYAHDYGHNHGHNHYYTLLYPIHLANNEIVAVGEIAVPINEIVTAKRQILLTLIASTLLIAFSGSAAAFLLRGAIKEEAVQHLRTYFLGSVTHEFRTPLAALRASVEFLVDEMTHLSRAEINELLRSIHMSVTGLQTLIDNLLEGVSIEAGQFAIHPGPMELDEVVQDAQRIMQPLLTRRNQRLIIETPPQLPLVHGDPTRLIQVLVNLLANASKYGPMEQTIRLSLTPEEDAFVRVAVADQGPGISPEIEEKLFRRFARHSKQNGAQHGLGLGLWVVNVIVTAHGGTVGLTQTAEGGSIFWFTIPISKA
jgi:signal transduction histidine kinase